jgi:hypothetical protein
MRAECLHIHSVPKWHMVHANRQMLEAAFTAIKLRRQHRSEADTSGPTARSDVVSLLTDSLKLRIFYRSMDDVDDHLQ